MDEAHFGLDEFELYQLARAFRRKTYRLIKMLPQAERFCLDQQMRRAAVSVSNNIAEGHGRWHYQENIQFCRVSRGSVDELIDDFNTCLDEGYGDASLANELRIDAATLIRRINSYIKYLKRCKHGGNAP